MLTGNLIDGRAIAQEVHAETESRVATLKLAGVEPGLVFIRVGEDPASKVYVGMKERTAARLGIRSDTTVLPENTPETGLLELLGKLNADASVHGVLVQAPLPVHIDDARQRVTLTSLATARAKEDNELLGPALQGRMLEYLPPPFAPTLFRLQAKRADHNRLMNVAVSNVPGPRKRGHIGGAPVTEIYSVGVLSAGSAFNMTVWSYVDQVDIAVLSDDATFDDPCR